MNTDIILSVITGSVIGTGFVTLLYKILEKSFDEWLQRIRQKKLTKKELADETIKICVEGATSGYCVMPRSQEHIQYIAAQLDVHSDSLGKNLRSYLGLWGLCALRQQPTAGDFIVVAPSRDDIKFCQDLQKQAKIIEDEILEEVKKWKK